MITHCILERLFLEKKDFSNNILLECSTRLFSWTLFSALGQCAIHFEHPAKVGSQPMAWTSDNMKYLLDAI